MSMKPSMLEYAQKLKKYVFMYFFRLFSFVYFNFILLSLFIFNLFASDLLLSRKDSTLPKVCHTL